MHADIFKKDEMRSLLHGKHVAFFGDSNVRAVYKDFLILLNGNEMIKDQELKSKMESSFHGDVLTHHGVRHNGRDYKENRFFTGKGFKISVAFYYLTRIYNDYLLSIFDKDITRHPPDIIFVNSCLWDITRWGPNGVEEYKDNLNLFAKLVKRRLGDKCLVVWITAPPISQEIKGGFLVPQLQFLEYSLRFHVAEANCYAAKVFSKAGFDVLDIHYYLTKFLRWRVKDGIHWFPPVVRYITNRLLTHISLAWGVELPHRADKVLNYVPPFDDSIFNHQITESSTDLNIQEESMDLATPDTTPKDCFLTNDMDTPTKDENSPIEDVASVPITVYDKVQDGQRAVTTASLYESANVLKETKKQLNESSKNTSSSASVGDKSGQADEKNTSQDIKSSRWDSTTKLQNANTLSSKVAKMDENIPSRNDSSENPSSSHSDSSSSFNSSEFKYDTKKPLFVLSQNTQNKSVINSNHKYWSEMNRRKNKSKNKNKKQSRPGNPNSVFNSGMHSSNANPAYPPILYHEQVNNTFQYQQQVNDTFQYQQQVNATLQYQQQVDASLRYQQQVNATLQYRQQMNLHSQGPSTYFGHPW